MKIFKVGQKVKWAEMKHIKWAPVLTISRIRSNQLTGQKYIKVEEYPTEEHRSDKFIPAFNGIERAIKRLK